MQQQTKKQERKGGELIAYIPPILPPQAGREQARRAHALDCYRKAARMETVHLFGIV